MDDIEILTFKEAVRSRPAMYFGNTQFGVGWMYYLYMLAQEIIQDLESGNCSHVHLSFLKDGTFILSDDGSPIAESCEELDKLYIDVIKPLSGFRFQNQNPSVSHLWKMNSPVMALVPASEYLELNVKDVGSKILSHKSERPPIRKASQLKNTIIARPDKTIFVEPSKQLHLHISSWMRTMAAWFPGIQFQFRKGLRGKVSQFYYPGGITDYYNERVKEENSGDEQHKSGIELLKTESDTAKIEIAIGSNFPMLPIWEMIVNGRLMDCLPWERGSLDGVYKYPKDIDLLLLQGDQNLWAHASSATKGLRAGLEELMFTKDNSSFDESPPGPRFCTFVMRIDLDEPVWGGPLKQYGPHNKELYFLVKQLIIEQLPNAWNRRPRSMDWHWSKDPTQLKIASSFPGGDGWEMNLFIEKVRHTVNHAKLSSFSEKIELMTIKIQLLPATQIPVSQMTDPILRGKDKFEAEAFFHYEIDRNYKEGDTDTEGRLLAFIRQSYLQLAQWCIDQGHDYDVEKLATKLDEIAEQVMNK